MTFNTKNKTILSRKSGFNTFELGSYIFSAMRVLIMTLILTVSISAYGQLGTAPTSSFNKFQKINSTQSYNPTKSKNYSSTAYPSNGNIGYSNNNQKMSIEEQNRKVMKMMQPQTKLPPTQAEIMADLERKKNVEYYQSKQEQQKQILYSILNESTEPVKSNNSYSYAKYGKFKFAAPNNKSQASYQGAYEKLLKMLSGEMAICLKDAIYEVENVFFNGTMPYQDYNYKIEQMKERVKLITSKYKLEPTNKMALQFAIQKLYTDTLYNPKTKEYEYPLKYDFNDIYGKKNYTQPFVSKLLQTGTGQCHSLPLLYKVIADEMGVNSYLSYSPSHSYIQFKDEKGTLYNYETTNGSLTSEAWITGSGFVKVEAMKSRIYTDTISTKQIIAQLLVELAGLYKDQVGYGEFMEKCINTSLKYYPNNIHAYLEKSNLETAKMDYTLFDVKYPKYEELKNYPEQYKQMNNLLALYNFIDDLGYAQMPKQAYEDWLKSLDEQRQKQENDRIKIKLHFNTLD